MRSLMKEYRISQELKVLYNEQNVVVQRGKRYCLEIGRGQIIRGLLGQSKGLHLR